MSTANRRYQLYHVQLGFEKDEAWSRIEHVLDELRAAGHLKEYDNFLSRDGFKIYWGKDPRES